MESPRADSRDMVAPAKGKCGGNVIGRGALSSSSLGWNSTSNLETGGRSLAGDGTQGGDVSGSSPVLTLNLPPTRVSVVGNTRIVNIRDTQSSTVDGR